MKALLPVIYHTLVIYSFLIVAIRFGGRRQLGQLTVIDLVIVILLGSSVETAMVNANTSLAAGLMCASVLLVANRIFSAICTRYRHLRHMVQNGPVILVHCGTFVDEHLRRVGLTRADVLEAMREREISDIAKIRFAVLEMDGTINAIAMTDPIQKGGQRNRDEKESRDDAT